MSKRKVQHKVVTQKGKEKGKPSQTQGWSFHNHGLKLLISLFLIVTTLVAFEEVRNHAFLNFDDDVYVTENRQVRSGLTLKSVIWASTRMHAGHWHPLTWLSHMLDCELYGLNPGGHHLTNLLFHIVNTLLLFLVLKRMTGRLWMSGFIAALFALHPLHVESVAWVAERKDVLSTFFWMLTMWAYVHYVERPRLNRYLLVLLCFTLGLSSKPMLVTLPFVLLLLDYWPLGRFQFGQLSGNSKLSTSKLISSSDQRSVALRLVWEKAPFFLLSGLSSILTIFAAQRAGAVASLEYHPFESRFANALVSYVSYIEKMIWPHHLAVFYPHPEAFPIWKVVGAGLLLGCLTVLAIRAARKRPYLVVGWLWYLGTLVPVIGLMQAGSQAMADRFTYVPLIGLFIMIVWGVQDILAGWRYRRVALSILAGVILLILMMVTRFQVKHWQNDVTLFTHTLDVTVNNALSRNNLGAALFRQGKYQEAIVHYTEALRIDPRNALARNGLGVALARQGRYQESVDHWKEVLRIKPDFADAHNNLGNTLVNLGKYQEAIAHYNEALRIKPDNANAHNNLGGALRRLGRHEEAIAHFTEALKIKSDYAEAHGNLGNIFTELGRVEEAIAQYNEALRIKSDFAEVRLSLGLAYLRVGNRDSAMKEYEILKRINPDLADALYSEIYK